MNRPIKFRVWDSLELEWKNPNDYTYSELFCSDKYIIQQFTGFKDKNGREIYEGDILEYQDALTGYVGRGKAEFEEGCFGVNKTPLFNIYDRYTEIIGNIFENPELI